MEHNTYNKYSHYFVAHPLNEQWKQNNAKYYIHDQERPVVVAWTPCDTERIYYYDIAKVALPAGVL